MNADGYLKYLTVGHEWKRRLHNGPTSLLKHFDLVTGSIRVAQYQARSNDIEGCVNVHWIRILWTNYKIFLETKNLTSGPKASNGQRFPCPALYWPRTSFGKQGSGPNRGRSPVEWGDFPYVHMYVRPY